MKNRVRIFPILFVLVIILGGCKESYANPIIPPELLVDPRCPTGITLSDIKTDENNYLRLDHHYYVRAFIVSPNAGCNLPIQYCVLIHSSVYGSSLSCTTIP